MSYIFYRFMCLFVKAYFRLKFRVTIHNKSNVPKSRFGKDRKDGFIVACNHQSYSDPPLIALAVNGRFSFMAKKELFERGRFFSWLIKRCGAFPVDRGAGDNSAIERAISDINKGRVFVIFPEGTRSKDGTIGRAKSGVALIAASANAPVLPVCIMYGLGGKRNIDIAIGEMIPAEEIALPDLQNLQDRRQLKRVSERIINAIKGLQSQIFKSRGVS